MIAGLGEVARITSHETGVVDIGLRTPMRLSFAEINSRPSGVAKIGLEVNGNVGYGLGEGATLPEPYFTDDSGRSIASNLNLLIENISGESITCEQTIEKIQHYEFPDAGRYPTARLTIEMGVLDAYCKALAIPMAQLLGTQDYMGVPYGKSIGALTSEMMISQALESLEDGAKKIKLKVDPGNIDDVIEAIGSIRAQDPEVELMVDANGGFDPTNKNDIAALGRLDGQGLITIEEPVSRVGTIRGLRAVIKLRRKLPHLETPICLDDCLESYEACVQALDEGLAEVINVKPGRIGSFVRSVDLVDYAAEIGKSVMVGGMLEATPGRCMTLQLGAYCLKRGFAIPGDLSLAQERLADDLVKESEQLQLTSNGEIRMPTGHGWGFSVGDRRMYA